MESITLNVKKFNSQSDIDDDDHDTPLQQRINTILLPNGCGRENKRQKISQVPIDVAINTEEAQSHPLVETLENGLAIPRRNEPGISLVDKVLGIKSEMGVSWISNEDELDHMSLRERLRLLTAKKVSDSEDSRPSESLQKSVPAVQKCKPTASENAKPGVSSRQRKRKKTATDCAETALEEDAPGLLKVLVEKGILLNEIKLYGGMESEDALDSSLDENSFEDLQGVISKLFAQHETLFKVTPLRGGKELKAANYCLSCLISLVEQSRLLQSKKWGWCRDLQSFIFVFERHNRIVLERPEYGYATYFFELVNVNDLSIEWQIKRLVTTMKLTYCSRATLTKNKSLLVGEDLSEGEARVLEEYGWIPNCGLGSMLNYCDRVFHDKSSEKDGSKRRKKIVKLLRDGLKGGTIVCSNLPKKLMGDKGVYVRTPFAYHADDTCQQNGEKVMEESYPVEVLPANCVSVVGSVLPAPLVNVKVEMLENGLASPRRNEPGILLADEILGIKSEMGVSCISNEYELIAKKVSYSEDSRPLECLQKSVPRVQKSKHTASENAKPGVSSRQRKRNKTATDCAETALEEDAPGLLKVLVEKGILLNEIKLYGGMDSSLDENSFEDLQGVISKLFAQRETLFKVAPLRGGKGSKAANYCLSCLISLVEHSRRLQFEKWPVEWGWCRDLQSFIFVFERHNRTVLERPEYGYATYFFELVNVKSLSIEWQIKRLVTTMKLTHCSRATIIENKSLLVGEDLSEGEARVLEQYGWIPNSGLGSMLNYWDRVIHDKRNEKDGSEWREKIGKLL